MVVLTELWQRLLWQAFQMIWQVNTIVNARLQKAIFCCLTYQYGHQQPGNASWMQHVIGHLYLM